MAGQSLLNFSLLGIPWYVYLMIFLGIFGVWWLWNRNKDDKDEIKLPRVKLSTIAKKEREEIFRNATEYELGKILTCGPESYGTIRKMLFYKVASMPKELMKELKLPKGTKSKPVVMVGYVTTKGMLGGLFYLLGLGLRYYMIETDKILNEDANAVYINPFSQRDNHLGFNIFSPLGYAVVENVVFKNMHLQLTEEMLNFLPKMTVLEIERAKDSATLTEIGKVAKIKNNEMLEQIRKGKT